MPTVHCPGCKRALNLPESAHIDMARCPMCQTTFPVQQSAPTPTLPLYPNVPPVPQFSVRQTGSEGSEVPPPPAAFDEDYAHLTGPTENAVASACNWMQGAGTTGGIHLFFCACVSYTFVSRGDFTVVYCGTHLFEFIVSLTFLYTAPDALRKLDSMTFVYTLSVLALLQSGLALLTGLPLFAATVDTVANARSEAGIVFVVASFAQLAVIATSFVAGLKTLMVAKRESARRESSNRGPDV